MQLPNITLVLQILHFFIAYAILKRFVFGPILQLIEQQNAYERKINKSIQTWQFEYESIIKKSHESWVSMKTFLLRLIPNTQKQYPVVQQLLSADVSTKLSNQQRQKMSDMVQDSLSEIV